LVRKPAPSQVQYKEVQNEIRKELIDVGKAHVRERERVVARFETDIQFGYQPGVGPKQVQLWIFVVNAKELLNEEGDATVGDLWHWLNEGTPRHDILPKNPSGRLFFEWGGPGSYKPITFPVARFSGPGVVVDPVLTVAKAVDHPGFPGRFFNREINKRLSPRIGKAITRGVSNGMKKI
jgi:hypothetical protein